MIFNFLVFLILGFGIGWSEASIGRKGPGHELKVVGHNKAPATTETKKSQFQQLITVDSHNEWSLDNESTVPTIAVENHQDKDTSDARIHKNRIDGSRRAWFLNGPGWDVRVNLRIGSDRQRVSSLDWATRWEKATDCLSTQEPDNADMFEMDELALEAFWDRVWMCYLSYAFGFDDDERL